MTAPKAPTTKDMLATANQHDLTLTASDVKLGQALRAGTTAPTPGVPADELDLTMPHEDPFGGNINNRKVAERISRQTGRQYLNMALPTHTGDPHKAAKDIARSKEMNPDPVVSDENGDVLPEINLPVSLKPPTAGSPAAVRAAKEAQQAGEAAAEGKGPSGVAGGTPPATNLPGAKPPVVPATPPWKNNA